ncbi:hypothetical protein ABT158_48590 [Nonomuraea sp. NPDC001636]|uniref:hypothetical protein n=1 Tax=Nonomuraea sp. NPDC001636 TaxID=3154391 RepID=UPI00331A0EBF
MTHDLRELHAHIRTQLTPMLTQLSAAAEQLGAAFHKLGPALHATLLINDTWHTISPRQRRAHLKELDQRARARRNTRWPRATHTKITYHRKRR